MIYINNKEKCVMTRHYLLLTVFENIYTIENKINSS